MATAFWSDEDRDNEVNDIILKTALTLAIAGAFNPIPLAGDVIAIIGGWSNMLYRIAKVYEASYDPKWLEKALREVFKSSGWYGAGTITFITAVGLLKWTGFGTIPAIIVNALLNAGFTVAVGNMYKDAWKVGQTPTEEDLASRIEGVLRYAKSANKRKKARKVYDEARKRGLSREEALEEVVRAMSEDIS